jgi:hypothetical protein
MILEDYHQQGSVIYISKPLFMAAARGTAHGAAIETVILLRECPPSVAENYAVAVRDTNAVLLKKQQQQQLARAE